MVVLTDLFRLILVALTLVIICLFVLVVYMIRGDSKAKAKTSSVTKGKVTHKCLHFVGYLADEHPRGQPIPDECFGCASALECIQKSSEENRVKVKVAQT